MKKFQAIGTDNNIYEFVFLNGRLLRVVISEPVLLRVIYGEYIEPKYADSQVSVEHFEKCFKSLCDDKSFNEYKEFIKELKTPTNNPEFVKIAKKVLKEKRKALITTMRKMTSAIKEI